MKHIRWATLALLLVGVTVVSGTSVILFPQIPRVGAAGGPGPEERARLKADMERARAAADVPSAAVQANAKPGEPVAKKTTTMRFTKAEMLSVWETGWAEEQTYLARLEALGERLGKQEEIRATVTARRKQALDGRARIDALPDGEHTLEAPSVKLGDHSIDFVPVTWDLTINPKDPINVVFFGPYGTPWDVSYRLRNWVGPEDKWVETNCGGPQYLWINDSSHTGGWDGLRTTSVAMESEYFPAICGFQRLHARMFGAFVPDSHGIWGNWTAVGVHFDPLGHACSVDWEGSEVTLAAAFLEQDDSGYRWFVETIWEMDWGNAGTWNSCANAHWNDGKARMIKLIA